MRAKGTRLTVLTALAAIWAGALQAQVGCPDSYRAKLRASTPHKPTVPAPTAASIGEGQTVAKINNWTVGLASGLPEGTFIRFGAEIARNLNDGDELRVIPMITYGATDNVKDLLYLKGVDVAFTNADVLEHFRRSRRSPISRSASTTSPACTSATCTCWCASDITSLKDLEGKKVSFHTPGAGASVSAPILFQRLGIKVEPVYVNNAIALENEDRRAGGLGELPGGKPQDLFTKFKNDYGYKFLSVPFDKFDDLYVPSVFTSEDYPGYIKPGEKVEALGVPVVLAVYNWPKDSDRFRRIQRFIEYLLRPLRRLPEAALSSGLEEHQPGRQGAGLDALLGGRGEAPPRQPPPRRLPPRVRLPSPRRRHQRASLTAPTEPGKG